MEIYNVEPGKPIELGYQGENRRRAYIFDVREWLGEYPDGIVGLLHRRAKDRAAWPIPSFDVENGYGKWIVTRTDTKDRGNGELILVLKDANDIVIKSAIWTTNVDRSLSTTDEAAPTVEAGWEERLITYKDISEAAAVRAENAVAHTPKISDETGNWLVWDSEGEDWVDTGVLAEGRVGPQGPKGDKGDKGETGEQGPQGEKGEKGETGAQGTKGDKGDKGDKGETGEQGPQGIPGVKGDTGERGPQGIQGETGPQGPQGEAGATEAGGVSFNPNGTYENGTVGKELIRLKSEKVKQEDFNQHTENDNIHTSVQEKQEWNSKEPGQTVSTTAETIITLVENNTKVISGTPTALNLTLPVPTAGHDYICGVCFKAGADFALTDTAPTGYTLHWENDPTWTQGTIYEILYRCLWVDNVISAKWAEVTGGNA